VYLYWLVPSSIVLHVHRATMLVVSSAYRQSEFLPLVGVNTNPITQLVSTL
jgi:hypothetical protein